MIFCTNLEPKHFTMLILKSIADKYTKPIHLPDDAMCLFCKRKADNYLYEVYEKNEIASILNKLSIDFDENSAIVDYICYVCVFRFSIISDYRNLVNNTYNKTRANYYYNIGDREKSMQFLSRKKSTSSRTNNRNLNNDNNTTAATSTVTAATTASTSSLSALNLKIFNGFLNHNNHENNDEIINGDGGGSSSSFRNLHFNDDNYAAQQDYIFGCLQYLDSLFPENLEQIKEIEITFKRIPRDSTLPIEIYVTTIPSSVQRSSTNTVPLLYTTSQQQQQQQQQTKTSSIDNTSIKNVSPSSPQGLEILYEGSPHPVLVTESGHANDEQYDETIIKPYECEMCLKRFARSRLLRKHQRQHYNNNNIDDGNNSSQQQKRGRKRKRRSSVTTKSLAASSSSQHNRTTLYHYCDICDITFENLKLFKKHNREKHERIYKCVHCTDSFCCRADWELHEAICYGKKLAEIDNNTENVNGTTGLRVHQTRSRRSTIIETNNKNSNNNNNDNNSKRSRRSTYNESNKDSADEEIEEMDSLYNEKVRSVNDWVENQMEIQKQREEDLQKLDSSSLVSYLPSYTPPASSRDLSLSRNSSVISRASTSTRASTLTPTSFYSSRINVSDLDGNTRRNSQTPRSGRRTRLRRRTINTLPENQQREVYTSLEPRAEFGVPIEITYPQLVYPKQFQLFRCPENGCDFVHQSLNRLMHHDIESHNQLPLFYCKICKFRFIRRFYYEQHLMFQCYGWHFCFKCEKRFDYLYALKEHLNLHKITIPHKCTICNLSFLTQNNLEEHISSEKHKKTILNKPPRVVFERYDYNNGNNESRINESNDIVIENGEEEQEEEEEEEGLQQIEENQNIEENLSQQQNTNENEDQTSNQDHKTQNEESNDQQIQEIHQDNTQNKGGNEQQIQEGQNSEQQLQVQKTTKQQQHGKKRPLPSTSSSSAAAPPTPPYKSIIKILKLVDTERSNDREVLTWYPGIVFELTNEHSQNCALKSSFPRRVFVNQN